MCKWQPPMPGPKEGLGGESILITCIHREGRTTAAGEGFHSQVTQCTAWLPSQTGFRKYTQVEVLHLQWLAAAYSRAWQLRQQRQTGWLRLAAEPGN